MGQPLDQPLDPKLNLKQLDNDSDRDENITVVPEKEAHSDIQILDHILKNFANLNIHKIINQGDEFTIHYFRLYLYAMKYHQSDIFLQINGISPYIQNFNQLYDQVKRIIIDVSYNWDGSTFKDKFISNSNITPIKLENNEIKGDIIKPVKINPIVLKRLGIE